MNNRLIQHLLLFSILLSATFLRLYKLEKESLDLDEIGQVVAAQNALPRVLQEAVTHRGNSPLDYFITHYALEVGTSPGILRFPSVIWGALSVLFIFYLGRKLYDPFTGLIAAVILTFLPLHIFYSREVRFYSLTVFLVIVVMLLFIIARDKNRWFYWGIFGLVLSLSMYAHLYFVVISGILGLWLILTEFRRRNWNTLRNFTVVASLSFVSYLPWLIYDFNYEQVNRSGIFNLGSNFTFVFPPIDRLLTANFLYFPQYTWQNKLWSFGAWTLFLISCIMVVSLRKDQPEFSVRTLLFQLLVIIGLISVLALDMFTSYFFTNRQFLVYTPIFVLAISATISSLLQPLIHQFGKNADLFIVGSIVVIGSLTYYSFEKPILKLFGEVIINRDYIKQDWRATVELVNSSVGAEDLILSPHPDQVKFYSPFNKDRVRYLSDDYEVIDNYSNEYRLLWIIITDFHIGQYPNLRRWLEIYAPIELTLQPNLKLYVVSKQVPSSELYLQLIEARAFRPGTLIFTDFIEKGIAFGMTQEINTYLLGELNSWSISKQDKVYIRDKINDLMQK